MNFVKTAVLLAGLTALFGAVGYALGGSGGMLIALGVAAAANLYAYWNADRHALSAHNAVEVDAATAPDLVRLAASLAERARLPMPRVYVIDEPQPNAFATGRNPGNSAVAVTTGLMRFLTRDELAGVIAHELAHIRNRDTHPATAPLFIVNPLSGLGIDNLFSTHPATENRIAALRELARQMGGPRPAPAFLGAGVGSPWTPGARRGPWG